MVTKKIIEFLTGKKGREEAFKKRQHPRLKAFNLIKFTMADGTRYESLSNVVDLSENGLKFTCYEKLPVGVHLKMLIALPEKNKQVPLDARLVWIRRSKKIKGVYVAGVTFVEISRENRELIRDMIHRPAHRPS